MVNLKHPELAELTPTSFPPQATTDALWDLRSKACSSTQSSFTLQSHQRFLRRVLSPDAPTRGVLVVHGTGTGKTCTAIQVAEEYILRPEFQDKKVFVVASAAVQETFRDQLFDMSRVKLNSAGLLESKQCTGRRYLDMLTRIEQEPKNWANPEVRDRLERTADRIISEFYEFTAYASFGNLLTEKEALGEAPFKAWVHETFDNRLVIIDEAHNIRPKADLGTEKTITAGLEKLVKTANGMILVLLTATPMYESYDEILLYFNLFRWNDHDRSKPFPEAMKAVTFFDANANLRKTKEAEFYRLCQDYVSYVHGENPFTFPFRLPPPPSASPLPTKPWKGDLYEPVRYLRLVDSPARGLQAQVLQTTKGADTEAKQVMLMQPTVAVLPGNADFKDTFTQQGTQWAYRKEPFLGPDKLPEVSAKFARVLQSINDGEGIAFVYSNYVSMGALLFAMALEEHGYTPYRGKPNLANPAYKGPSKGSYVLLTSKESDKSIANLVSQARSADNREGAKIRVIISSPLVAEGVDFRCVRQAHILDPWWNMSRIEQVIGRSLRTCSHTLLTNAKQNCTVYLHVVRTPDGKECYDEYTYRTKVVAKAEKIAKVRSVLERAAMDCPFRVVLPDAWLAETFRVPQQQSEGRREVSYSLRQMLPPSFDSGAPMTCIVRDEGPDTEHVRPLSSILDVRDELLDKLGRLLQDKPIWDKDNLVEALKPYTRDVSLYTIQQSIDAGTRFQDAFNRQSVLESKGSLVALRPVETAEGLRITTRGTVVDRLMKQARRSESDLPEGTEAPKPVQNVAPDILATKRAEAKFPGDATTRFSPEILDAYVVDHLLTEPEKRAYLRATPEAGDKVRVAGTDILIRGYQQYDPDEIPIGEEASRVDEWKAALAAKFLDVIAKNTLFASLGAGNKFTISKVKKVSDTEVVRGYTPDSRMFLPTTCGTGGHSKDVMLAFAKTVDKRGVGIPTGVSTVGDICIYSELLAREQTNCVWFTPEELSVLYGDPTLKDTFTAAFKKTKPS
jgi:superfamily II DNA or RNA helicase